MKRSIPPKPKLIYMVTKAHWGGAQKYVYQLATSALIRKEFEVIVVVGSDGELVDQLRQKGIHTDIVPIKNSINPFSSLFELARLVTFLKKEKPSVVHINSSKMALFGSIASRIAGIDHIVFTAHGWTFTEKRPLYVRVFLHALFYTVVHLSSVTICVAESLKKKLRAPAFLEKKLVIIYNGLEETPTIKLTKLSEGSKVKHVVTIGYIHPNKGQDTVFRILPFIDNIHYHVIGENQMGSFTTNLLKKKKIENKVTLYGHVTNAQRLLSQYDLFLIPSRTEALPYVVLEALRAGLPVVARRVGGIPEIINGVTSSTLYDNDNELIDILKRDIPSTSSWNDSRFKIDTMIRKTAFEYQRLIDSK